MEGNYKVVKDKTEVEPKLVIVYAILAVIAIVTCWYFWRR
jgi:hypothetical protein